MRRCPTPEARAKAEAAYRERGKPTDQPVVAEQRFHLSSQCDNAAHSACPNPDKCTCKCHVPVPEGGGDNRALEQIDAKLADTIVNATTTRYYDTSQQSDERIKRLLLEFAREIKRKAIEP